MIESLLKSTIESELNAKGSNACKICDKYDNIPAQCLKKDDTARARYFKKSESLLPLCTIVLLNLKKIFLLFWTKLLVWDI